MLHGKTAYTISLLIVITIQHNMIIVLVCWAINYWMDCTKSTLGVIQAWPLRLPLS